ncbi:signal transducer and transcription activator 6-like [Symphorus nematophorus]
MASPPQCQQHLSAESWLPNMLDLDHLVRRVQDVQDVRQKMHQLQGELNEKQNCAASQGSTQQNELDPTNSEVQKLQTDIQQLEHNMKEMAKKRIQLLNECVDCLDQCQSRLISRLKEWRWEQQKAAIGRPFDNDLSPLQTWCEQLFEVNKNLREELMLIEDPIPELRDRLAKLLEVLVQSSLVVDKQPPQVIEIHSRFSATLRCLLGEKAMLTMLRAKIINEQQARDLGSQHSDEAGELFNNTAVSERDKVSKSSCATFRNMRIKSIKRADRPDSEPVTEQKYAILFSTEIFIPDCGNVYRTKIISLPVVVISRSTQSSSARATILWDCAFSEADRVPFSVPEQVPWRTLFSTLNSKFTAEVQTQRNLDQQSQHFLAQKIFAKPDCADDFSNTMVSWAQFNKQLLPRRPFTFWQWFEGVMELTKMHLESYWSEGLIFGFMWKQNLYLILKDSLNGTFLLYFSDSEIGGITIAFVFATETGVRKIQSIQPYSKGDLEIRSLGDRILDINHITHLYPDTPKHQVFKRFYSVLEFFFKT